jgi:hypothetical protein
VKRVSSFGVGLVERVAEIAAATEVALDALGLDVRVGSAADNLLRQGGDALVPIRDLDVPLAKG